MRHWLAVAGRALAAFLCAAVVWELLARSLVISGLPSRFVSGLGHIHTAGTSLLTSEGFGLSTYDANGYRNGLPNPRRKELILALGDSYTEGAQVSDAQTYCQQANSLLKESGIDAYIVNAGGAGESPANYVGVAPWYLSHLHPDQVVVQIDLNDFLKDLPNQTTEYYLDPADNGFQLKMHADNEGFVERLQHKPIVGKIGDVIQFLKNTSLIQLTYLRLGAAGGDARPEGASEKPNRSMQIERDYLPFVKWSVQSLKSAYKDPILIYLPVIDYFDLQQPPPKVEVELQEECRLDGVTLIDMRSAFVSYFLRTGECPNGFVNTSPGFGHYNSNGHRLIAEALASAIKAKRAR